jgi:divinyl protochlorophyllide a 8-vinyl-reductase
MHAPVPSTEARIGPNAVIQLGETLLAHGRRSLAREVYLAAGHPDWLAAPPAEMLPEAAVAELHAALRRLLPEAEAAAFAAEAGRRTGDYVLANRIPRPVRMTLRLLPPPLSSRLLLEAIEAHAWTFAGSGRFTCRAGLPAVVEIAGNPLAGPSGCDWHTAVFERLFQRLVHDRAEAHETRCCGRGEASCRFEISWPRAWVASRRGGA